MADGGFPIKYVTGKKDVEISSAPKETRMYNGRGYVLEESIVGDVGLVKAWKADTMGNLVFRGTARNFNPECAAASRYTIAEVEEIVPAGSLAPESIHVPSIYVHSIVKAQSEKRIERLTLSKGSSLAFFFPLSVGLRPYTRFGFLLFTCIYV